MDNKDFNMPDPNEDKAVNEGDGTNEINNTKETSVTEKENAPISPADVYSGYAAKLGEAAAPEYKETNKRSSMMVLAAIGILLAVLLTTFAGAFAGMYFICKTTLLGDSEFFASVVARWGGVTVNKMEVDQISGQYVSSSIDLADKVLNTTVLIRNGKLEQDGVTFSEVSSGSGAVYSVNTEEGYSIIVTNYHVIEDGYDFRVETRDGKLHKGEIKWVDSTTDLAIIKVDKVFEAALQGDSDKLVAGQQIIVAGNPLGLGYSVAFGFIAHPDRDAGSDMGGNLIQLDASVNPGNSGGGVYDAQGNLIGIVVSKAIGNSEDNVDGIGYAIPINRVNKVISDLASYGYVKGRPALRITVMDVLSENTHAALFAQGNELTEFIPSDPTSMHYGVYVVESENANLKKGDKLVSINGVKIIGKSSIANAIASMTPGSTVKVVIERATLSPDGKTAQYTKITLNSVMLYERNWGDDIPSR